MASEDLSRIENKVDKLAEAVMELVRLEEKMIQTQGILTRFGVRADDIEQRVEFIEKRIPIYDMWAGWANKVAILVIMALCGAVLGLVLGA
jgi:predicted nuclease with TOPRIM domain